MSTCRKRAEAGAALRGEAAEHGHRRGHPGASGVQSRGDATAGHLLEERQRHNPSLERPGQVSLLTSAGPETSHSHTYQIINNVFVIPACIRT